MLQSEPERARVVVFDAGGRAEALGERLRFLSYEPVIAGRDCQAPPDDAIAAIVGQVGQDLRPGLGRLAASRPHLPFLLLGGDGEAAVGRPGERPAWRLDLPVRRTQLERLLRRAARYRGPERRHRLIGTSAAMRRVRSLIEQVADFDTTVLVTGESGTGKELVARTIHDLSPRCDRPFVPINCGAIPPDLLESELFGHEKGAFSGAVSDRVGRFELAEGGTLFLDEIGDMSLPMQVKLLRVLQERTYERVGSNRTRRCDLRIIAATHRDLPEAVRNGTFREDLYYRLNVFPIEMPPLAKRRSDLPALLDELLSRHQVDGRERLRLTPEAISALASYSWPGNVRELGNLVERLVILHPHGEIGLEDLPEKYRAAARTGEAPAMAAEIPSSSAGARLSLDLKSYLQQVEQDLIRQAMQEAGGVVAQAARLLGMRRTTLVEKLQRLAA
ncbi:MAG TPA: sigma-54 dependent transcriptional regulator [Woeseiaceae bacterium]|nr:sigma-54 dependent transcriptional regulator [Woeseiaceae bacterium]